MSGFVLEHLLKPDLLAIGIRVFFKSWILFIHVSMDDTSGIIARLINIIQNLH